MAAKKLPKEVEQHLNSNTLFNRFGIVNIKSVKAQTECKIPDEELKELIKTRFAKEMVNEYIEFTK